MDKQVLISLDLIDPNPYQPRQVEDPEAVAEIAASIKQNGLMQVPSGRQVNGRYQLAFGHTRKAAFLLNGETSMPLIVRDLNDLQMFELGVAENIKRRDLNPIEQADAMRRYMDEFGKSSVEAGEFFGVAEETVRQKVRLLKLPDTVQTEMRTGGINENTARALLQMQRVASPDVVEKTVQKIKSNKDKELPEDVIEFTIEHLPNVVEFRKGDGVWPIEMKKFPNKFLPAMTEQEVGVYESVIEHMVEPPACNACPFHTQVRGTHYCGMKVCYQRKQVAWGRHILEQTSKNLNIPVYNKENDGGYVLLASYESTHSKLFASRHAGLRLLPKSEANPYTYQSGYDGVNDDFVFVVATGKAIDKLGTTGRGRSKGGKKTEGEKAEMRMMKVYRVRRKEFMWAFTDAAKVIFSGVPVEAVKKLKRWKFVGVDDSIPDEYLKGKRDTDQVKADFERRELVWAMMHDVCSHYHRSSMATILNKLQKQAAEWKIKVPASLTRMAEQYDAEIQAAAAPKAAK